MPHGFLGAHFSTAKGLHQAVRDGHAMQCGSVQVFTSSPRMWKGGPADTKKAEALRCAHGECGEPVLVSHDTYLVNLAHPEDPTRDKSIACLTEELQRSGAYGIRFVVSHIASALGQEADAARARAVEGIRRVLDEAPAGVTLLMETTAGQGSAMNRSFDELSQFLNDLNGDERVGVCLDTCHIFAAGYDIRTPETYAATFDEFGTKVGFNRLKVIHCNDSQKGLGTKVDRHANLGKGMIGIEAFRSLVNDPRLANTPIILETPTEEEGHAKDLATLRELAN
ncbi:deoxyribonuclease IV [bacterium]|nr:MAG: deoxyribonuclease IV [bacterium]